MQQNSSISSRRQGAVRAGLATAVLCAGLAFGGLQAPTAAADAQPLRMAPASENVSLAEATRMVREHTGGQVLRAETRRDKGRTVHRIRVLTDDGRVRNWHVDAETGRIY
ncbi:MAG: PepSY domain-containing protein [Gammaproteobacteria bacterium]